MQTRRSVAPAAPAWLPLGGASSADAARRLLQQAIAAAAIAVVSACGGGGGTGADGAGAGAPATPPATSTTPPAPPPVIPDALQAVKYQPIQPDAFGTYPATAVSEVRNGSLEPDAQGVMSFLLPSGERFYHPFNITSQATGDNGIEGTPTLDMAAIIGARTELSSSQQAGLGWLMANAKNLSNGGITWIYTFPLYYRTFTVLPPWPSAFTQGRAIQAFIAAWRITKDAKYLSFATRAAKAYALDVSAGGLQSKVDGYTFFEEVPLPDGYAPHILNGHLYSVAMLFELYAATHDPQVAALAAEGAFTFEKMAPLFDSGNWTKYDLIPRLNGLMVCLNAQSPDFEVLGSSLLASDGSHYPLSLAGVDGASEIFLGNLPQQTPLRNFMGHPGYTLRISHRGGIAKLGTYGMRDNVAEYYELKPQSAVVQGGVTVTEYRLPFEMLADWSLTRTYQGWHARLARKIGEQTGDPSFTAVADRWDAYRTDYDRDMQTPSTATCNFRRIERYVPWGSALVQ